MNGNGLPDGWKSVRLGDLGSELREAVRPKRDVTYELYSVPAYADGRPEHVVGEAIGSSKRVVRQGDLLICKINPRINRVWIVEQPEGIPQLASTEYLALRLADRDESLSRWLHWYLRSPSFRSWIKLNVEGATGSHTRAKSPAILGQFVPIAPKKTRERVVSLIDEQAARIEIAEQALKRALTKVAPYRLAVLSDLMPAQLSELPRGWSVASLGELALRVQYGSSSKTSSDRRGVPVLRMGNIVNGSLKLDDLRYLPQDHAEFPDLLLSTGDLLFNRTNSAELVGKSAVYRGMPNPSSFASYLIRVQLRDELQPEFIAHVLNGPYGKRWIASVVSQQVGQANVSGSKLKAFQIPVPPLAEQRDRVEQADARLSLIDQATKEIRQNLRRAEALRESILRRAFTGDLH